MLKKKTINLLRTLKKSIKYPEHGLGEELFLFVSSLTPIVNVDLLIKNQNGEILLTWREKMYHLNSGWHVPGGVVRYKEYFSDRIRKVAEKELSVKIKFESTPIDMNEIIIPELEERGHFISFLFNCSLIDKPNEELEYCGKDKPLKGQWKWFEKCPENLFNVHKIYKKYFKGESVE